MGIVERHGSRNRANPPLRTCHREPAPAGVAISSLCVGPPVDAVLSTMATNVARSCHMAVHIFGITVYVDIATSEDIALE